MLRLDESAAPHRAVYFTLRSGGLVCSAGLDGPPELFGFSGAQLETLFLRGSLIFGDLLRLTQLFYRQSSSIRSLGPSVLRAWGPWGLLFSSNHNLCWGQCTLVLRQPPNAAIGRVREMDLSRQKAGRRSRITTRAAEGRG